MKKSTRKASTSRPSLTKVSWTPALLAKKKGVTSKAIRAYLRRHYDSPKGDGWTITAKMADAVLAA